MKVWRALIVLGVFALASGGALVILNQHRTIGLAGLGLGALLLVFGVGGNLLGRRANRIEDSKIASPAKPIGEVRRAIAALFIVFIVGLGTFYGASYISSTQTVDGTLSHSTRTGSTSRSTAIVSTGFVSTSRPFASSTQIVTGLTSVISTTGISSVQNTTATRSCLTTTKSLDGSAISYNGSGASGTIQLSTLLSPDLIVVFASAEGAPNGDASIPPTIVSIVDSAGSISFHRRASLSTPVPNIEQVKFSEEEWVGIANVSLSNDDIHVVLSANSTVLTVIAFGVAGADIVAPFDPNSGVLVAVTGSTTGTISAAVTTSCPNDMIVGGAAMASLNPRVGSGFTLIESDKGLSPGPDPIAEFKLVSSPQTDLNVSFENEGLSGPQTWIIIADSLN